MAQTGVKECFGGGVNRSSGEPWGAGFVFAMLEGRGRAMTLGQELRQEGSRALELERRYATFTYEDDVFHVR